MSDGVADEYEGQDFDQLQDYSGHDFDSLPEAPTSYAGQDFDQLKDYSGQDFDSLPDHSQQPQAEGHVAADVREAAHGLIPMATGVLGAAAAGAALGSVVPGAGNLVGGLVGLGVGAAGMLAGSAVGTKIDAAVSHVLGVEDEPQRQANREARPIETQAAGLIPFAGSPVASLGQRAVGGALMGAFSGGQQLVEGKFDPAALATDVGFGAAMPSGNRVTRALHGVGEKIGGKVGGYIPGRPDTQAREGAAEEKEAATASVPPNMTSSGDEKPGPSTSDDAVGDPQNKVTRSSRDGAKDAPRYTADDVFGDSGFSQGPAHLDPTMQAARPKLGETGLVEAAAQQQQATTPTPQPATERDTLLQNQRAELERVLQRTDLGPAARQQLEARLAKFGGPTEKPQPTPAPEAPAPVEAPAPAPVEAPAPPPAEAPAVPEPSPAPVAKRPTLSLPTKPQGVALRAAKAEASAPPPAAPEPDTTGLRAMGPGMAKGITDSLHDHLWSRVEAGRVNETDKAAPSALLQGAKQIRDKGGLKTPDEFKAYAQEQGPLDVKSPTFQQDMRALVEKYSPAKPAETLPVPAKAETLPAEAKTTNTDADTKLLNQLHANNFKDAAARFEALSPEDRDIVRDRIAGMLPQAAKHAPDRSAEKAKFVNKNGKLTGSMPELRRHNSAIDAIREAFDAHPPKPGETGDELQARLLAAVETAHRAHGNPIDLKNNETPEAWRARLAANKGLAPNVNPLDAKAGYRPNGFPETFQWFDRVQKAAGRKGDWTPKAIAKFKADELATRGRGDGPKLYTNESVDASIAKTRRGGDVADAEGALQGHNPEAEIVAAMDAEDALKKGTSTKSVEDAVMEAREGGFNTPTEEDETPGTPQRINIPDRETLRALNKRNPKDDLTAPVSETKPAKEKTPTKLQDVIAARAEAAMKESGTKRSGITLTPDEVKEMGGKSIIKGTEVDPAEKARILKEMGEAETRRKSRSAPTAKYIPEDKYGPLKGLKDMFGNAVEDFSKNESGELRVGKIKEDLKKLKDSIWRRPVDSSSWTIGRMPTYIAKEITAENQQAGRNVADRLTVTGKVDNSVATEAIKARDAAHEAANTPEKQRQLYDALARKDPSRVTDPELKRVYDTLKAAKDKIDDIRDTIETDFPETNIGRRTEDGMHREMLNGGPDAAELERIGADIDPVAGPLSTTKRGPVMERNFVALEDDNGKRHVVHLELNGAGKPTGKFSIWKGYKNFESKDIAGADDMDFKLGGKYEIGKRKFTMHDATEDEIEKNAFGTDSKPAEYQRDAAASVYTSLAYHLQLLNHLETIKDLKESPEFLKYATLDKDHPDVQNRKWQKSETPGFEHYWMDEHMREALEDAYQPGVNDSALAVARNFSRRMTQSIFWMPVAHAMNVAHHWNVARGFDWIKAEGWRSLMQDGATAIKSVISHDAIQQKLAEHGAGLIYPGIRSAEHGQRLAMGVAETIQRNPKNWTEFAKRVGMSPKELVKSIYKGSSHSMWSVNDMFLTQAILENLRKGGKTIDSASSAEIKAAIAHVERHIPNYRTPERIIGSGEGGRFIAKKMRDPLYFGFGRYRYAVFNSMANMIKSVAHGDAADRKEAIGQMTVMAVMALGVYPYVLNKGAQYITGNDAAEARGRGPIGPFMHAKEAVTKGDFGPLIQETVSLSPLLSALGQLVRFKDFSGRDIIDKQNVTDAFKGDIGAAGRAGAQLGGYLAQQRYSPLNTLNSALGNPNQGAVGGLRDAALDIKNPSDASQKHAAKDPARRAREHVQRDKTRPNIGDKALGWLGQ